MIPGKEEAQRQEEARRADAIASAGKSGDMAAAAAAFPYQVGSQEVFNPIKQWASFTIDLEKQLQSVSLESTLPVTSPRAAHQLTPGRTAPIVRHTATSSARISAQYSQSSRAELPSLTAVASQSGGASLGAPRVREAVGSAGLGHQKVLQQSQRVAALRTGGNRRRLLKHTTGSSQVSRDEAVLARMRESTALLSVEQLTAGLGAQGTASSPTSISFDFSTITQLVALKEHLTVELCRFLHVRKSELLRALGMNAAGDGKARELTEQPQQGVLNDTNAPHRRNNRLAYRGVDTPTPQVQATIAEILQEQSLPSVKDITTGHPRVQHMLAHNASAGTRRILSLSASFMDLEALLRRARLTASLTNESGTDMDSVLEMQAELRETRRQLQSVRAQNTELSAQLHLLRRSLSGVSVPHARGSQSTSTGGAASSEQSFPYNGLLAHDVGSKAQSTSSGSKAVSEDCHRLEQDMVSQGGSASQIFTLGVRLDEAMLRLRSCNDELLATREREAAMTSQLGMLQDEHVILQDKLANVARELAVTNTWYKPRLEALEAEVGHIQQATRDARAAVDLMGGRFAEVLDEKAHLEQQLSSTMRERDSMAHRLHECIKQLHAVKNGEVARLQTVIAKLQSSREHLQQEVLQLKATV